jgi:hypothetical protein
MSDQQLQNEVEKAVEPIYPEHNFGILKLEFDDESTVASTIASHYN